MSQVSRQNAQTDVKKDFYKLMSNLNFGYDCRSNTDNCFFQPIYDEIEDCPTQSTIKMFSTSKSLTLFQPRSLNVDWGGIFEQIYAPDMQDDSTKLEKILLRFEKKSWTSCS